MTKKMTLGDKIDAYYALRQKRLELQRSVDDLKSEEARMTVDIMGEMDSTGLGKASGAHATCGITTTIVPLVEDWDLVHKYVKDNDRFDLLQKRMSSTAWRDMVLETGELVPGTLVNEVHGLSLTKSKR